MNAAVLARVVGLGSVAVGSLFCWSQTKSSAACEDSPQLELKLVQVLFRHGARTPLKSIPDVLEVQWVPKLLDVPPHTLIDYVVTDLQGGPQPASPVEDSYREHALSGGTYPGQLTTIGMQQLYDLGTRLRARYIQDVPFLTPSFTPAEVYIRSTNIVRTIESAKCLVAGLFQQKQTGTVPILTSQAETEILYPNYHGCKLLRLLSGHRWAESAKLPDIAKDIKEIQGDLGIPLEKEVDFILIRDDMVARQTHGLACPPQLDNWKSKVEQRAVDMIYHVYEPSKKGNLQLCVGPLLHTMLSNMEEKVQGTSSEPHRKLFLYSVHDTTLMPCLMALGIFDMRWPPYAADITMELLENRTTKEAFVKVLYLGKEQHIPGCSSKTCPLKEFQQAMAEYALPLDRYNKQCEETKGFPSEP
ncbi:lysophosphatidic acid phosphatase type 6 [Engraulis encrasicolus]|uniref:lysophosphatidic acid phosphatase type 6 n=1 Tax=Engraulis encrasicolus TaxID=184585 RepID=UPI002FCEDAC0